MYDREVLERLDFIKRAQVLGFPLDEIKQIISEKQAGESPCEAVRDIVRIRLRELDEHMRYMRRYRNELAARLAEWDKTGAAEGHICGLIEGSSVTNPRSRSKMRGYTGQLSPSRGMVENSSNPVTARRGVSDNSEFLCCIRKTTALLVERTR